MGVTRKLEVSGDGIYDMQFAIIAAGRNAIADR